MWTMSIYEATLSGCFDQTVGAQGDHMNHGLGSPVIGPIPLCYCSRMAAWHGLSNMWIALKDGVATATVVANIRMTYQPGVTAYWLHISYHGSVAKHYLDRSVPVCRPACNPHPPHGQICCHSLPARRFTKGLLMRCE